MRVIEFDQFGGPEVLRVAERETPVVGERDVLIEVTHIGVNFSDVLFRRGAYPGPVAFPVVTGNEAVGVVRAVGAEVTSVRIGMRVAAWLGTFEPGGGYVDELVTAERNVIALPAAITEAAALACLQQGLTAALLLERAAVGPGTSVLVHAGTGGVGSLAIQLAKARGARVVALALAHASSLRELGADAAFAYDEDWPAGIKALWPHGIDVVLDSVGGAVGQQGLDVLAPFGRVMVYGAFSGTPTTVPAERIMGMMFANQSLMGFVTQTILLQDPARGPAAVAAAFDAVLGGSLTVVAHPSFDFEDAAAAHRALEDGQTRGKVVLHVPR